MSKVGKNFKFKADAFQIPGIKYISLKDGECKTASYTDEYNTSFTHKFVRMHNKIYHISTRKNTKDFDGVKEYPSVLCFKNHKNMNIDIPSTSSIHINAFNKAMGKSFVNTEIILPKSIVT